MPATSMANFLEMLVTIAVVLIAVLYINKKRNKRENSKLPPGCRGWPLIGEILSFMKPCPSTTVGNFMEQRISRYGKIFSTNLLGKQAIVSADAELNRFVLQNENRLFANYLPQHIKKLMGEKNNPGLQTGDAHKEFRSILVGSLLSSSRIQTSIFHDANELAAQLITSWKDDSVVAAVDVARTFTSGVIVKNLLGMEPGKPETEKFRREFNILQKGLFAFPLNFFGTQYNKALKARKTVHDIIKNILEERKREGENTERNDFIGWARKNTSLSIEQICETIQGLQFAAEETTATVISLVIYFLESSPKVIEQLREEHLQVVGSRMPDGLCKLTWDGYKQMEFTQCVINEALRLGSIARFQIKEAIADVQFKGYEIPRGCKVITHFCAVHLDPCLFEDPQTFNPWRWRSTSGIKKTNNFMGFGGGPRQCPGGELARLETAIFLHHLILNYNWKLVGQDKPISTPTVKFRKGLLIKVHALEQ